MTIALMQPYFFPYLGYFQQIQAVDCFVFYDDVNYIKQGWINRNQILMDGQPKYITVPLSKASSFKNINETYIHKEEYSYWKRKFYKSLHHHYGQSPNFNAVIKLIKTVLNTPINDISTLAIRSVIHCSNYLGLHTDFKISSKDYSNNKMNGKSRIIDICEKSNADIYINSSGGEELYDKNNFEQEGIKLNFLHTEWNSYPQDSREFIPKLSIIDMMMNCSMADIQKKLNQYTLL